MDKIYSVVYQTPADKFDPGGASQIIVTARTKEDALIKAHAMYYGETRPTCKPPHPVKVTELA